ncbi:hypothetical protein IV203_011956 [Nitzschia inconspicua]|uniref:Uncharacterized protein n=1 Tax=Nitzschia inconspicua TaxID=303405 RepID=A0A9K3KU39_9STRA|nr:hypothetical protein IV203_011956 [Nitzschia inconspicua]
MRSSKKLLDAHIIMADNSEDNHDSSPPATDIMHLCRVSHQGLLDAIPNLPLETSPRKKEESSRYASNDSSDFLANSPTGTPSETTSHMKRKKALNISHPNEFTKEKIIYRAGRFHQRSKPSMVWRNINESSPSKSRSHSFSSAVTERVSNTTIYQKLSKSRIDNYLSKDVNSPPKGILKNSAATHSPQTLLDNLISVKNQAFSVSSPTGVDSPISPGGTHIQGRIDRWSYHSNDSSSPAKIPLRAKSPFDKRRRKNLTRSAVRPSRNRPEGGSMSNSRLPREGSICRRSCRSMSAGSRRRRRPHFSNSSEKVAHRSLSPRYTGHRRKVELKEHRSHSSNKNHHSREKLKLHQATSSPGHSPSRFSSPSKQKRTSSSPLPRSGRSLSPTKVRQHKRSSRSKQKVSQSSNGGADNATCSRGSAIVYGEEEDNSREQSRRPMTPSSSLTNRSSCSPSRERLRHQHITTQDRISKRSKSSCRSTTPNRGARLSREEEPPELTKQSLSPTKTSPRPASEPVRNDSLTKIVREFSSLGGSWPSFPRKPIFPLPKCFHFRSTSPRARSQTITSRERSTSENQSGTDQLGDVDSLHLSPSCHEGDLNSMSGAKSIAGSMDGEKIEKALISTPQNVTWMRGLVGSWSRAKFEGPHKMDKQNQ